MRLFILALFLFDGECQEIVTACQQAARDKAERGIKKCKSLALREILGREEEGRDAIKQFRTQLKTLANEKQDMKELLCKKVYDKYEPNGLIDIVPPNWGCEMDDTVKLVLAKVRDQHLDVHEGPDAFNIVLVGRTGAGKSYFGNALLGTMEPGRQTDVPFPAKETDGSVTQNIYAVKGVLFDGLYDDVLGLDQPMKINVFDTPGFADASVENLRKNKLLIATALKYNIDMIVFVSPNPRFDQSNQDSLEKLNEWTSGKLWDNLIVAKARTVFDADHVRSRIQNDMNLKIMKDNGKIVRFLSKRQRSAGAESTWNITELVDGQIESKALTPRDFKKLQVSLMNMAQHRECIQGRITEDCWRLPQYDDRGDYLFGEYDYEEETPLYTDKFVFVEEAKQFVQNLRRMSSNPIVPSAVLFQRECEEDIATFDALLMREEDLDRQVAQLATNGTAVEEAQTRCEEQNIDDSDCPTYGAWGEWTECAGCGEGASRARVRSSCFANGTETEMSVCELDSMTSAQERAECVEQSAECVGDGDQYNNENAILLAIMKQNAEAARLSEEYNRKMIQDLMVKMTENSQSASMQQSEMMRYFQQQSMEFQQMSMKQQAVLTQQMMQMSSQRRGGCLAHTDTALLCDTKPGDDEVVMLTDLKRNDRVWSYNAKSDKFTCAKVIAQHTERRELIPFVTLTLGDEFKTNIKLTEDHLIYVVNGYPTATAAKNVKVGDVLKSKFGEFAVVAISTTLQYPVSPHTTNGVLLVNGVVASTLTTKHGHTRGTLLLKIAEEILSDLSVQDAGRANAVFDKLVAAVTPFVIDSDVVDPGTKMFEAVRDMLSDSVGFGENKEKFRAMFSVFNTPNLV